MRRVSRGQSMIFFPEGTFSKVPGLLRFHTGAFVTAVRADCPVIPIVIRGARHVLPYNRVLLKPGVVEVEILSALLPKPADPHAAANLRDEARSIILAAVGEPDLAAMSHVAPILSADIVKRA